MSAAPQHLESSLHEARRFLELLFEGVPGCIDLRLIEPDGECERIPCASIDDTLKGVASARAQTVNIYVGIATRRTMSREKDACGKRNLAVSRALWIDFDFKHDGDRERFEDLLRMFPLPASMAVLSGGGMHVYWLLEEPYDLTAEADIPRFEHTLKGLCDYFGADRSATDASRILRIPGTVNHPDAKKRADGRVLAPCHIFAANEHIYAFDAFEDFELRGEAIALNGARVTYDAKPFDGVLPARVERLLRDARIRGRFDRDATGLSDQTPSSIDFSLASMLAHRGLSGAEIEAALRCSRATDATARPKHDGYFTLTVEKALAASVPQYEPGAERDAKRPPLTDLGNAERFVAQHGAGLRYCPDLRDWLRWDGTRWQRVKPVHLGPLARETVRAILGEAQAEEDSDRRATLAKHAAGSESEPRIRAMIGLATAVPGVLVGRDALDSNLDVLNVLNGTLHLDSGELRPHRREDLITKLAPVRFDPEARSEEWERAIEHALPDVELRKFFARAVGYALGGPVQHDAVFFVHGPTGSAKSTIVGAIEATLGDYAASCEFSTFLRRGDVGGTQPGLAKLPGVRVAVCNEVEPGRAFNVGLLKAFSAGDTVTCHAKYEAPFTFRPLARLWLVANDRPEVAHTDGAVWRRLMVIPFEIPVDAPDEGLKVRLRDPAKHGPAILAWALRGRADWLARSRKLDPPASVVAASLEYRASQNPLGAFVADMCQLSSYAWTASAMLQDAFAKWSSGKPLPDRQFTEALKALGCESSKRHGRRGWSGVELIEEGRE